MVSKSAEKIRSIELRKQGKSYNEILKVVPVAKSTLSLWLREVGLSKAQKQKLTAKKQAAQQRGGDKRREMRLAEEAEIFKRGRQDIARLTKNELFLLGVALYWAEGTKRSGLRPGSMVDFANSDPAMVRLFVKWLKECCEVSEAEIELRLHIHESHRDKECGIQSQWTKMVDLPDNCFTKTLFKKHNPKTIRYKVGVDYIGLVSVRVRRSTVLNRRIMGWIYAIIATQK